MVAGWLTSKTRKGAIAKEDGMPRAFGLRFALLVSVLSIVPVPVAADMQSAIAAYDAGNYKEAFSLLEPLAVQGDPQARFLLGKMYAEGQGVLRIYSLAHTWLTLAADQGIGEALYLKADVAGKMSTRDIIQSMERQNRIAAGDFTSVGKPRDTADDSRREVALANKAEPPADASPQTRKAADSEKNPSATEAAESDGFDGMSRRDLIRAIQEELNRLGFSAGTPDGIYGPSTRKAIQAFQKSTDVKTDGEPSPTLLRTLRATDRAG